LPPLLRREVPVTVRPGRRTTSGRYVLADAYLRFYFRFIAPNQALLEQGLLNRVWEWQTHYAFFARAVHRCGAKKRPKPGHGPSTWRNWTGTCETWGEHNGSPCPT
jgi:hypothetical protein